MCFVGFIFSHLIKLSYRKGFINRESYVAQYLALTFFTIGITSTIGSDDLLAAFAAGKSLEQLYMTYSLNRKWYRYCYQLGRAFQQ